MKCCATCFGDRILAKNIIPSLATEYGSCAYCTSTDVPLVEPGRLADLFGPLINIYEREPSGRLLVEWLKEDWGMFDHPKMDIPNAKNLLADVLDNGEIVRAKFVPSARFSSDGLGQWEVLRRELMYSNRYFPESHIDTDHLKELLDQLRADDVPNIWYRARIQQGNIAFSIDQMGPPEKHITSHGRANPAGIPYLYLGSTEATAISEVRPHTGETACVADFALQGNVTLIDLRNPRKSVSPFVLGDEDAISAMRTDVPFLERLGEELTRPVLPQVAAIEYVPSQYLCEFIKKCRFDGVIYRSSVGEGMNLALFDPTRATPRSTKQRRVAKVTVVIEESD